MHGGLQGMLCDEVFAGLIYGLKRQGALAEGPAVTANLSVNFRKVQLRPFQRSYSALVEVLLRSFSVWRVSSVVGLRSHAVHDGWPCMQPMPAQIPVLCTAKVQKMEGRKVFVEASIGDLEGGVHYADATALFILMQLQNKAVPDHPS